MELVAYANRLPVSRGRQGWRPSGGGLVAALRPALEREGGTWVGWDGGASDVPERVQDLELELRKLVPDTLAGDPRYAFIVPFTGRLPLDIGCFFADDGRIFVFGHVAGDDFEAA